MHGAFLLHVPPEQSLLTMIDYDYIIVEEIGRISGEHFLRLMQIWNTVAKRSTPVFEGDFCQLPAVPSGDEDTLRAFVTETWNDLTVLRLHDMNDINAMLCKKN